MAYSEKVLDHYENPRNVGSLDKNDPNVGTGMVGAPACGDVMNAPPHATDGGRPTRVAAPSPFRLPAVARCAIAMIATPRLSAIASTGRLEPLEWRAVIRMYARGRISHRWPPHLEGGHQRGH